MPVERTKMGATMLLVSVVLFSVNGLWLTAVLYALFAGLSVAGWRAWTAMARAEQARG